ASHDLLRLLVPPTPATSTLFPYTTLFRSQPEAGVADRGAGPPLDDVLHHAEGEEGDVLIERAAALEGCLPQHVAVRVLDAGDEVDRKSTRLNSSHVKISYAVFCLKKKTHT